MGLFFLAIAAGALTILAPCILPLLPFLLGTSGGQSKWRPLAIIIGFVGTFSIVGAALATAGTFLGIDANALRYVAVVLLTVFGFALLFESVYDRITAKFSAMLAQTGAKVQRSAHKKDIIGGVMVGFSLGLVWTPCAGPILGAILTLSAQTKDFLLTLLLMFAYALGAGIPMFAIAYGGNRLQKRLLAVGRAQPYLNKVFGILIILTAIAIFTGYDIVIQNALIEYYPEAYISNL